MNMSLRYEVPNPRGKSFTKKMIERERIMNDELMAERVRIVETEKDFGLKARWAEGLEESSKIRQFDLDKKEREHQLHTTKKALVAVRRDALRTLLESEYEEQERELHRRELAFYVKRT